MHISFVNTSDVCDACQLRGSDMEHPGTVLLELFDHFCWLALRPICPPVPVLSCGAWAILQPASMARHVPGPGMLSVKNTWTGPNRPSARHFSSARRRDAGERDHVRSRSTCYSYNLQQVTSSQIQKQDMLRLCEEPVKASEHRGGDTTSVATDSALSKEDVMVWSVNGVECGAAFDAYAFTTP